MQPFLIELKACPKNERDWIYRLVKQTKKERKRNRRSKKMDHERATPRGVALMQIGTEAEHISISLKMQQYSSVTERSFKEIFAVAQ